MHKIEILLLVYPQNSSLERNRVMILRLVALLP